MKKQIICASITFAFITLLFWAGGFNFDHRGEGMLCWLYLGISLSLTVFFLSKD